MAVPLRVLLLEDSSEDAELLLEELCHSGFTPEWKRVYTAEEYLDSLEPGLELILADYNLPQFDAPSALRLLQERELDIPFIVVTGAVSEEVVVECMKLGAADYLLKDRLSRLGLAVTHTLEQHRRHAAEREARKQADEQNHAALREKETLLREVHHRVKNNLAIIDNLLVLQASKLQDPSLADVFRDCRNRIHSMVAIHEQLYRARDFGSIDFGAYAAELCNHVFQTYGVDTSRIQLKLDVSPVPLDLNRAVPLGLLLNELLSNTLKHAFPAGRRGVVTVRLQLETDGRVHFTVADDGIGIPPNLDLKQRHTLGLQLIQFLSRQVGGTIAYDREQGTVVRLAFPHSSPGVYSRDKR